MQFNITTLQTTIRHNKHLENSVWLHSVVDEILRHYVNERSSIAAY